jgi:nucleosome-remodeling factor subunit BPTF
LPINKTADSTDVKESSSSLQSHNSKTVNSKQTPEEIKEKMEQQLKIQRAAHHQKRQMEMKQGK